MLSGARRKTMVQAFVISLLDYCNALCYGITDELTRCLQSVQNAAAKLVTGTRTRRCDHISPVLHQLHWLPVPQRVVHFQDCDSRPPVLVRQRPGYLADDCQLVADACFTQLRFADTRTVELVSRMRSSFGDKTFVATGPQVWNSLPPNLRLVGLSYGQ